MSHDVPPDCPGSWLRLTDADQAPAIGPAFSQEQTLFSTGRNVRSRLPPKTNNCSLPFQQLGHVAAERCCGNRTLPYNEPRFVIPSISDNAEQVNGG
jgi:hypothetical protein